MSDPIFLSLSVCLSDYLSLSGIQSLSCFPYGLWPLRSHPPCPWPSESEQPWESIGRLIYWCRRWWSCRRVSRGLHCFTIPQARPVLWVSGDLVIGCSGSEAQCQRTCGRLAEIWGVCCNGVMSLFAATSSQTGRGWRETASSEVSRQFLCNEGHKPLKKVSLVIWSLDVQTGGSRECTVIAYKKTECLLERCYTNVTASADLWHLVVIKFEGLKSLLF